MIDIETHSEQDTIALGAALGRVFKRRRRISAAGGFGRGKNAFCPRHC